MEVTVERIGLVSDDRGSLWEPIEGATIAAMQNCHVVITQPGGIRGNHFHRKGTEIATLCGPALVMYRDISGLQSVEVPDGETVRFVLPPNCPHAFKNHGDKPNLLVAFNTEKFVPDAPDSFPEVLIEP